MLGSSSPTRAAMLERAGLAFTAEAPHIDEDEIKHSLNAEQASAVAVADTLAELKARHVSRANPDALVIGADQVLDCNGTLFDKPPDMAHARAQLAALRGHAHVLATCVCVVRGGTRLWHHVEEPRLTMRAFSDEFLDSYLDDIGAAALRSVGAYQVEGLGAQLFSNIDGDYFTILGLPLLPLLDFLRGHGAVAR
ncbi:MAG: Maf-like protein [Alphaproteobacteria bacterium]|nr:Maf-like protein [Alphaproteobacteria bacterium]